jgi:hypothetical protein
MLPSALTVALALPMLLGILNDGLTSRTHDMERKCRNPRSNTPLHIVDGNPVSADSAKRISMDSTTVGYVSVICLSTSDSTTISGTSPIPGLPTIVMWTKAGSYSKLRDALRTVRESQSALWTRTKSFERDTTRNALPAAPAGVKLTFTSTTDGWLAVAALDHPLSPRCKMSGVLDARTKSPVNSKSMTCSDK